MGGARIRPAKDRLTGRYPPSPPCTCAICVGYCRRPGWWTVREAAAAIDANHAGRMMLEMAPELTFAVLAPAFKGNEGEIARQALAGQGCTFLHAGRCELYGTGLQPLECRFCHHSRPGQGERCHRDIERDWNSRAGQRLVIRWCELTGLWQRLGVSGLPVLGS